MRTFRPLPSSRLALLAALLSAAAAPALAQSTGAPARPGLPPGPPSATIAISSSSNEHGTALWVVDSVQHTVTLCEKVDTAKDFTCAKKPLP